MRARRHVALAAGLAMLVLAPTPAMASLSDAAQAYNAHQYGAALAEFERLARGGNSEAQLYAGLMHDNGLGAPRDAAKAFYWYMQAAKQDQPRAQFNVADMLYTGSGTRQDRHAAMVWYQRSANNGFAEAQYRWGMALQSGRDVPKDVVAAFMWLTLAASQDVRGGMAPAIRARDALARRLTRAQMEQARHKIKVWRLIRDKEKSSISL